MTIASILNLENKLQSLRKTFEKFINYECAFVFLHSILLKDKNTQDQECLVIIILQTEEAVPAINKSDMSSYFVRQETGKKREIYDEIKKLKKTIHRDNFDFVANLEDIIS